MSNGNSRNNSAVNTSPKFSPRREGLVEFDFLKSLIESNYYFQMFIHCLWYLELWMVNAFLVEQNWWQTPHWKPVVSRCLDSMCREMLWRYFDLKPQSLQHNWPSVSLMILDCISASKSERNKCRHSGLYVNAILYTYSSFKHDNDNVCNSCACHCRVVFFWPPWTRYVWHLRAFLVGQCLPHSWQE